mmetsp:Transcript_18976/g.44220  ORF Transcript_18976/g.44220 Transcript_18976/m.44220 type:complete len:428 (-) Transcript_18976:6-1289(-)
MAVTWRTHVAALTSELERLTSRLDTLESENAWLRDLCDLEGSQGTKREGPRKALPASHLPARRMLKSADRHLEDHLLPNYISEEHRSEEPSKSQTAEDVRDVITDSVASTMATKAGETGTGSRSQFLEVVQKATNRSEKVERIDFMILRAQKTKVFAVEKPWFIINPDDNYFAAVWQGLTCLALLFVALMTPVQVCLFATVELDALFVVSILVDGIFLVDMILQFFTTYSRRTARGIFWETKLRKIARRYLKSWFCVDVLTLIPFDLISMVAGGEGWNDLKALKALRTLRLLKLMRLFKSSRLIHRLEIPMAIPYQHLALMRFLVVLLMTCHWLACLWALTLQLVDPEYPRWINDIESSDLEFGIKSSESPLRIYTASFYFCAYTMTSVGYGDIGPKNIFERVVCTWMVLVAGLCWAYILGEVLWPT